MDGTFTLPDGRRLSYRVDGDPAGVPVVLFGGLLSSRFAGHPDDELTRAAGVRLVRVDRPGYGGSDRHRGHDLLAVADDARRLTGHLGADAFGVVGLGAGAAYALAVAMACPERARAVALVAPFPPSLEEAEQWVATDWVHLLRRSRVRPLLWVACSRVAAAADQFPRRWLDEDMARRHADQETYAVPAVNEALLVDLAEALRQGAIGLYDDVCALAGPWGFAAEAVRTPVRVWHGRRDQVVSFEAGRALAARLPQSGLTEPDGGHLLYLTEWTALLRGVAAEVTAHPQPQPRLPRQRTVVYEPRMQHPVRRR